MRFILATFFIFMTTAGAASGAELQIKDAKTLKRVEKELSLRVANKHLIDQGIAIDRSNEGADAQLKNVSTEDLLKALNRDEVSTIYGPDARVEAIVASILPMLTAAAAAGAAAADLEAKLTRNLDGVAGIVRDTQITFNGVDWNLTTETYKKKNNLCDGTKFQDEPVAPFCTAFLVAPRVLVTAGHCYNDVRLDETRFVFGFRGDKEPFPKTFKNDDVYIGADLIRGSEDYAIITLNRDVVGRAVLPVDRKTKVKATDAVYVIGHPAGLPLKYAPGAIIRSVGFERFTANLDVLGGNSGSPVFLASTHDVIGMHTTGDDGYILVGDCHLLQECPTGSDCLGEGCLKAEFIPAPQIPALPPLSPPVQP